MECGTTRGTPAQEGVDIPASYAIAMMIAVGLLPPADCGGESAGPLSPTDLMESAEP